MVKSLQSSVHLASSGVFKRIFVNEELSSQLNIILKGLIKVASNMICVSWFDEIAIELLVIVQSVVGIGSKEKDLMVRYVRIKMKSVGKLNILGCFLREKVVLIVYMRIDGMAIFFLKTKVK